MGLIDYLRLAAVQHALVAATLVAVISGLIGPFVITRRAAFAVHGVAELSFTGAVAGLVWANNAVLGALLGSLVVAGAIATLGVRQSERDAAIGVTLAFGLGVGVYLLAHYHRNASAATSILFGQILGVSTGQIVLLSIVAAGVLAAVAFLYRPLLFASVDPEVAEARGVPVRLLGLAFLVVLALTVTEAAQIVGTLLVLSLAITPAAAAHRLSARPSLVAGLSIAFALLASDGGVLASLTAPDVKTSVFITTFSFAIYVLARLAGTRLRRGRRAAPED
ncbi:MAG TPA: metal ABC transporter permease [Jatrophihabitantaceae bacterium]|nr:metal ABC transporter permease [Jatrophihabitantaceae bacterium]